MTVVAKFSDGSCRVAHFDMECIALLYTALIYEQCEVVSIECLPVED